jgi:ketosteroid isomerase-like protein
MPDESTTADLVERYRDSLEAANRRDFDAMTRFWAPEAVWDTSPAGVGKFEGLAAFRGFFEDWVSSYQEFEVEAEEVHDLGNGITFAILVQRGRPVGSRGEVRVRSATVGEWTDGLVVRVTNYPDVDEARAAATRLAEERG